MAHQDLAASPLRVTVVIRAVAPALQFADEAAAADSSGEAATAVAAADSSGEATAAVAAADGFGPVHERVHDLFDALRARYPDRFPLGDDAGAAYERVLRGGVMDGFEVCAPRLPTPGPRRDGGAAAPPDVAGPRLPNPGPRRDGGGAPPKGGGCWDARRRRRDHISCLNRGGSRQDLALSSSLLRHSEERSRARAAGVAIGRALSLRAARTRRALARGAAPRGSRRRSPARARRSSRCSRRAAGET